MEWNIKEQLIELSESEFQQFTSRLMPGTENVLGVRLPLLRKMAKKIARSDWRDYLCRADEDTYEEIMLKGMVIGYVTCSVEEKIALCRKFVPKIDNWSVCDSFCSGFKTAKEFPEQIWEAVVPYLFCEEEYQVRFALVMFLMYYVEDAYVDEVLNAIDHLEHQGYYVRMAAAWAVSICFIRYQDKTMRYLEQCRLDDWTYNKALQKIRESQCVDRKTKELILSMKR